jgi:hypothetical protein
MITMSPQSRKDDRAASLAVVRWRDVGGGAPVSSYPLPRPLADAVARAFAATYPRENFWVEDIPWLPAPAGTARLSERQRAAATPMRREAGATAITGP